MNEFIWNCSFILPHKSLWTVVRHCIKQSQLAFSIHHNTRWQQSDHSGKITFKSEISVEQLVLYYLLPSVSQPLTYSTHTIACPCWGPLDVELGWLWPYDTAWGLVPQYERLLMGCMNDLWLQEPVWSSSGRSFPHTMTYPHNTDREWRHFHLMTPDVLGYC